MKYTATDKTAKEKTKSKNIKTRVIPGYHLSLGIVITMLSVNVLIPLASVLVYSLKISPGDFVALIMKENVRNAFITSITSSFTVSYTHLDVYKRQVYETAHAVNIPIIGMGGITNAADAIEMILAGATAVSVGTAKFVNPKSTEQIVDGIAEYMDRYGVKDISKFAVPTETAVDVYKRQSLCCVA